MTAPPPGTPSPATPSPAAWADRLYALLPSIHRVRDNELAAQAGLAAGPLRELLAVIGEQLAAIEENLEQLYDDQFIETCADWVVPYLGDLVGYQPIRSAGASLVSRAEVANTIRHRRGKGTAVTLEGVARDVTGRDVAVVEAFRHIAVTQNLNHIRPAVGLASMRNPAALREVGGPFDSLAHGAEVRAIGRGGRWNLPNVLCFLWPWRAELLLDADPFALDSRRFTASPLGIDLPLINRPVPVTGRLATPDSLPTALRVRGGADMAARIARSVQVTVAGVPAVLRVCDLSDAPGGGWANMPAAGMALDPERGRIAFAAPPAGPVRVSYAYGSPGLLGGGPYARAATFDVSLTPLVRVPADAPDLAAALGLGPAHGAIEVSGNGRFAAPAGIVVAGNRVLEIRAANGSRPVLDLSAPLVLTGGDNAELVLDGFLVIGAGLSVPQTVGGAPNGLARLTLRHCTLVPGLRLLPGGGPATAGAPSVTSAAATTIAVRNCVCGPLWVHPRGQIRISDSVIDAGGRAPLPAVAGAGGTGPAAACWIYNATIRGSVVAETLPLVSNTLFLDPVTAARPQNGIVRFSFLPGGSATPRRYSCTGPEAGRGQGPLFAGMAVGTAGYARLLPSSPPEILAGADDGGQIGAWHGALDTPALDGLATRLAEYTRFGLESGVFHVPGT